MSKRLEDKGTKVPNPSANRLQELKKGCKKRLKDIKMHNEILKQNCGDEFGDIIKYCPECKARIDEREKMEKEVDDIIVQVEKFRGFSISKCSIIKLIRNKLGLSEDTKQ